MSRPRLRIVSVSLPLAPSTNRAFAGRRGSHLTQKTAAYRFWLRQVAEEHGDGAKLPCLFHNAPYGLWIDLPATARGDIDNRVKLVSDALKAQAPGLGVVTDDKFMNALHVELATMPVDRCVATVVLMADWPSYVYLRLS